MSDPKSRLQGDIGVPGCFAFSILYMVYGWCLSTAEVIRYHGCSMVCVHLGFFIVRLHEVRAFGGMLYY